MNIQKIKQDFPIFQNRKQPFVYLDSAATSQKPQVVIDAVSNFYAKTNANIHRGIYELSEEATEAYENARAKTAKFIGAKDPKEIVFTGNTNEAINLIAYGWARKNLQKGDVVVLSEMEHHANIVPWIRLHDEIGITLHYLPVTDDYRLDYQPLLTAELDISRIRLISLTHASNVLGTINPVAEIIRFYKEQGINAKYCIDAAQSVPHFPVSVQDLGCDFLAFSSHKMFGPSGIGILWAKQELLEAMEPLFVGSHMITSVTKEKATWNEIPWKFEPGTGKLEAVVGLGAAIDYINSIGFDEIVAHEQELTEYALGKLSTVYGLQLYGPKDPSNRLPIFSFTVDVAHAHDVAQILDRFGVCVRSGHHCAQPLMEVLGVSATARASLHIYNDTSDIDALVKGLSEVKKILKI